MTKLPPALPPLPPSKPALPPLAPVERKTLQALRRGRKDVDSVIDLHGMRQEEAHFALLRFLHRAQGSGHALVLVITGKGRRGRSARSIRGARRAAAHGAALAAPARPAPPRDRLRGGLPPSWRIRRTLCQAPPAAECGVRRNDALRRTGAAAAPGARALLKDMAAHLGVSSAYLSALERGERGKPTWTLIQGVLQYFHIIWDEADELARLADLSDPRVKIDTAGTRSQGHAARQPPRPGDRRPDRKS